MIAYLVRRHLAHPGGARVALLGAAMLAAIPHVGAAALLVMILVLMSWRTILQRGTMFEASLPIRGREVVMARVLATLALVLVPMIVWIGASLLRDPDGEALSLMLEIAALAALGVAAALVVVWRSVPDALQVAPVAPPRSASRDRDDSRGVPATAERSAARPVRADWRWAMLRSTLRSTLPGTAVMLYLIVLAMATIGNAFTFFCLAVLIIPGSIRMRTRWLAALPLSHRARLLAVVVPAVVISACCVALGGIIDLPPFGRLESLTRDAPSTSTPGHYFESRTAVSVDHWLRAPDRTAPVITAPWGERTVADTATVLGIRLYNPYSSGERSSARFVEWQFERATAAVYGRPLSQAQYDAGVDRPPRDGGDRRAWLVNGAALLTLGLAMLLVAEIGYSHRWRPGSRVPVIAPWLAALPVFAITIASMAFRTRGADVVMPLLRGMLRTLASALPANAAVAFVLAAVPVAVTYALLERQFRRSEPARIDIHTPASTRRD